MTQAKQLSKIVREDGNPNEKGQDEALEVMLGQGADEVPKEKQRKRAKTYRSKKEMEELRTFLAKDNADLDKEYREAVDRVVRWYFCEIETEDLLHIIDDATDAVEVSKETKKPTVKRKRRIRMGE
jgi:hypothetical protein